MSFSLSTNAHTHTRLTHTLRMHRVFENGKKLFSKLSTRKKLFEVGGLEKPSRSAAHVTITHRTARNTIRPYQKTFANWNDFLGLSDWKALSWVVLFFSFRGINTRRYPNATRHITIPYQTLKSSRSKEKLFPKRWAIKRRLLSFISLRLCGKLKCRKLGDAATKLESIALYGFWNCCATAIRVLHEIIDRNHTQFFSYHREVLEAALTIFSVFPNHIKPREWRTARAAPRCVYW